MHHSWPIQNQEIKKARLGRFTVIIMIMTGISRLCGFVRDVIFAHLFGASAALDAFVIAFKIPNFMRRLFGEGAFSQAFVPVLVQQRTENGHAGVQLIINRFISFSVDCRNRSAAVGLSVCAGV
jgi:putative peptidoglycan lipid II flippase